MLTNQSIADLHIHSCASDSTDTPQEIITQVLKKNIKIISLTDHNSVENQIEFLELAADNGLTAFSGTEISSLDEGISYHILAYGFSLEDNKMADYVKPILDQMKAGNRRLISKMVKDFPSISLREYDEYKYERTRGGWESVNYLYDKGITKDSFSGLSLYRTYNCDLSDLDYPSSADVIKTIHSLGGYAVLAHPTSYLKSNPDTTSIIQLYEEMKSYGIDGIECYYPSHTDFITNTSIKWCHGNNMMITVGCDSHGDYVADREIGKIRIPLIKLNIDPLLAI